jgi:hypothetical protein
VLVASALTSIMLAGATTGVVALQKSFIGYKLYAAGMNDGSRLSDYISRDLRNATKIARIDSGVSSRFSSGSLDVSGLRQLVIVVPNYFLSNIPNNLSGSDYKRARYSRLNLAAGQDFFPYNDVVTTVSSTRLPKYPGEVEVRYLKKARSAQDPTISYFRQEYEAGTLRLERDIAEKVNNQSLVIQAVDERRFRIFTSFAPKWSGEANRTGTRQYAAIQLLNKRRD